MITKAKQKELISTLAHAKEMCGNSMPICVVVDSKKELDFVKQYTKTKRGFKKIQFRANDHK